MREKLDYIWFYYKWYIITAICLLIIAVDFAFEKSAQIKPDHQIAIVTGRVIEEAVTDKLAEDMAYDETVLVNYYNYDARAMQAEDTSRFSAAAVQLANDFKLRISCCYITDEPELLSEAQPELVTIGKTEDFSAFSDCSAIEGFTILTFERESASWIK